MLYINMVLSEIILLNKYYKYETQQRDTWGIDRK